MVQMMENSPTSDPTSRQTADDIVPPSKMGRSPNTKVIIAFICIGVILAIAGIIVGALWLTILGNILFDQLTLTPSSMSYGMWKETPIPMYLKLHLFNWTNADKFGKSDELPHFVEMGPYVFREIDIKVNQVWNDNGTITFQRKRVWHFDPDLSNGALSDKVTNINAIAATIAYAMRHKPAAARDILDRIMESLNEKLVVTKTAGELLFDGYDDILLTIAIKFNMTKMKFKKFAWFAGRNGSETYDGTFNMLTGRTDFNELGQNTAWNYENHTNYYSGECSKVTGSNGDLWAPITDNTPLTLFANDICTYINLTFANYTEYMGLPGKTYHSDKGMFDNGTTVPARSCFCPEGVECIPSGVLNVSSCKFDAPAFISLPHFYLADESYRSAISGMNPTKENHDLTVSLQPDTGLPLEVHARLQVNLLVRPDEAMKLFKNIKKTFIPVLWFEQEVKLTEEYASLMKFLLILPMLGQVTFYGIAAIGILIFVITMVIRARSQRKNDETQNLLPRRGDNGTNSTAKDST